MTRPLCPYPQSARYKGSGDPNRAENFVCTRPNKPYHPLVRSFGQPRFPSTPRCSSPACGWRWVSPAGPTPWRCVRALAARSGELGLVLHAAHLHHGLRGAEADGDLEFCRELAAKLGLPFHEARVDTAAEARADPTGKPAETGKSAETIEEAARRLRYAWFRNCWPKARSTQSQPRTRSTTRQRRCWPSSCAERGPRAWPAFAPILECPEGRFVRPLLAVTRAEIEAYLGGLGQDWREDSSNRHLTFTRNRIRHELLPLLEGWNPRLREHLAQMAAIARDEEAWWQAELARLAPQILLPGRPARGGGRAAGRGLAAGLALEVNRLAALAPALQRRLLRHAAEQFGVALDLPQPNRCGRWPSTAGPGRNCCCHMVYAPNGRRGS